MGGRGAVRSRVAGRAGTVREFSRPPHPEAGARAARWVARGSVVREESGVGTAALLAGVTTLWVPLVAHRARHRGPLACPSASAPCA